MTEEEIKQGHITRKNNLLGELGEKLSMAREEIVILSAESKEQIRQEAWKAFYRDIAYWAVEYIDELKPKELRQPAILVNFYQLSEKERKERAGDVFRNWEVEEYFRKKNANKSNLLWLRQILEWFPEEDSVSKGLVQSVIEEYSGGAELYKKIKTFSGEVVND